MVLRWGNNIQLNLQPLNKMIKFLFFLIPLLMAKFVLSEELLDSETKPSMINIPDLFNAEKTRTATTLLDATSFFLFDSVLKHSDIYLYSNISNLKLASGLFSFTGGTHYSPENGLYSLQFCKLFYNTMISKYTVGLGIGYDHGKKMGTIYSSNMNKATDNFTTIYKQSTNYNYTTNTYFGNINGIIPFSEKTDFMLGADLFYNKKNGFELTEIFNKYTAFDFSGSPDAICYKEFNG
jgi:hypothetical protein